MLFSDFLYMQSLVAVINNGRAMSDEDYSLVAFLKNVLKQLSLGVWVECACSLVEEHDASAAKQCASDGYTLCLSFAQSSSALATDGVDALWQ